MKILKFGGTSVANSKNIAQVASIVSNVNEKNVVVVSALGGVTDLLLEALYIAASGDSNFVDTLKKIEERHLEPIRASIPAQSQSSSISFLKSELNHLETILEGVMMLKETTPRTIAKVSSYGEILSSNIINEIFKVNNIDVALKDGRDLIETQIQGNKSIVNWSSTQNKIDAFFESNNSKTTLVPGFVARDADGNSSTLGRGGSDFTAAILAYALNADILEIWTDVSGMYTSNPKLVKQATPINKLSYFEAMELSHFGAKVIFPPTLQPLVEKQIPVLIKNTFAPEDLGTRIDNSANDSSNGVVKGISHIGEISLISLEGSGMVGIPGFSKRLFEVLSVSNINVIMITQASSEHSICIAVRSEDDLKAKEVIDTEFAFEISLQKVAPASIENNLVNVAIVGDNMKNHQGISGKMFSSLGANNVNIRAIAQGASERNISIMINKKDTQKALNTLHETFFENDIKELNLFIIGVGNVGSKLLEQIEKQKKYLEDNLLLRIRVIAISNSRKMILGNESLDLNNWEKNLENGVQADVNAFFNHAKGLNLRNSIFVDNTANASIAYEYERYLNNNIGVVTCNKIACADSLENYKNLKRSSRKYGSPFLFETNVGAGLPIIDTLNNLIASGDQIVKIQAVLSGSLNFVFNNFKEGTEFKDVVVQAQKEGYTEPDPKIDLSGIDVARKILILARESGMEIELDQIENVPFLPKECLDTPDNDSFFESLITHKDHFDGLLSKADAKDARLKYVAQLENGIAKVGLQEIPEGHDFYNLEGSDNIILFYTNRYINQPLIVKGAGAGAEVTASGIFADIIRIGKR
ncbi:bifunctional aspartate kinase/homoserine dehydrogenase I [Flavobacteriaceae bacterium]|uniref:bifunctional aspartate kinase/homoserine dehydrogenase I n=1 Tax=Candidatus Arcticimaribacter forsetii TaxID=2820661 RepID=UPI0020771B94|nr:bifunctional aspartate kinase/homoserine dehydrogenase I [Candidatus Arcticimaribacter forsetii]MDA8698853.1 bifunctional aspartate kinase/homoserine dehydrogenase I [Flavobacteriaceae bacterium]MDB2329883.1 bifunctional aspartate kinase/homoserine dehydrogenase I [Flavobacteriaceae bacterium]MDB4674273.1 bifunctional aspartate kinase/homoserine dehydrogenase I [Flavobacteriaceae bacterium]